MSKSKVNMPANLKGKCQRIIHTASTAAAAAGAIPVPMSDAIPITAIQIGMIVGLGEVFGIRLSESAAKSIESVSIVQQAGRTVARNIIKMIPGFGWGISAATAAALTEALGWMIADDFYRMYEGEEPEDIVETAGNLKSLFNGLRMSKG